MFNYQMKSRIGDVKYGLRKAKLYYTSLPSWVPKWLKNWVEDCIWWVSKKHDNDLGKNGTVSKAKAHWRFIGGVLFRSEFPIIVRPIFALIALPVIIYKGHGEWKKDQA